MRRKGSKLLAGGGLKIDYVCSPGSFRLQAREDLNNRIIVVTFFVGEKVVYEVKYRGTLQHFGDKDMLADIVKKTVKNFMNLKKEYVQTNVDFLGISVYNSLKEVRTKLGTLLWKRR